MAQGYITQEKDYWIHSNALSITLNALGNANRIQCSVSSGAVIMAFIDGNTTLGYNAAHNYKSWPLSASPTYFNSDTAKYVYVAIPRTEQIGTQAVVVFPSEELDIDGKNVEDAQIGSTDYLYIFLGAKISATDGTTARTWESDVKTGKLYTDQGRDEERQETEWYEWSSVMQTVTFLKRIVMSAGSWFQNIRLGSGSTQGNLTGVATASTPDTYIDSETLVVTPSYLEGKYLSKTHDDVAAGNITFQQDVNVGGDASVSGNMGVKGWIKALRGYFSSIQSDNYTGDGIADTGYLLTSDHNGNSKLIVDELYVRIKAVFEELQVKRETVTGGNQVFSCAANVINRTDYYNRAGGIDTLLGYTEIKMPWLLRRMPTFLRRATLGVFSTKRNIRVKLDDTSNITFIRCYFLAKEGEQDINNLWAVNDLARCQTFNLKHKQRQTYVAGTETQVGNVFWWRKVIGISSTPVEIDGRLYHYFDVSMSDCTANSDLPAAGDEVSQWGNTTDTTRMNLRTIEVNGANAPADKWYRGIYTFDMSKCWWGGNPRKDMISAADGVEFYGPTFKYVQEYGVERVVTDRGAWSDITTSRDDYGTHGNVRKCYYYDRVSHNGSLWLCSITDGVHWVDGSGNYITDAAYAALTEEQKALCSRKQDYTTQEPSESATDWTKQVEKGDKGDTGDKGDDGENGKDGWMITADPANVIITQNMVTTSTFTTSTVSFTAKKGSVNATISSIGTPSSSEFNVAKKGNSGDNAKKVVVSSPKTYTPSGSSSTEYYTEGSFTVQVNVTDPDTNTTVVFNVVVPCYANLLGKWTQTIEDGVETSVATKLGFVDPSTGVYSIQYAGTYIRGWAENTSILTRKVNKGKNLLSGVLNGAGWKSAKNSTIGSGAPTHDVSVDVDGYLTAANGDGYIHMFVALQSEKTYTLSFYSKTTSAITVTVYIKDYPYINTTYTIPASAANVRKVLTFNHLSFFYNNMLGISVNTTTVLNPQIELNGSATAFEAPDSETTSQIRQTADEIDLSIVNRLGQTGINIDGDNRKITLSAENVEVTDSFTAKKVVTETDNAVSSIEGGLINFASKQNLSHIEFGIDANGNAVLNYYGSDGSFIYGLGPTEIFRNKSQAEEMRLMYYNITSATNNKKCYSLLDSEIESLYVYVYKNVTPANSQRVFKYFAQIANNVYGAGEYCQNGTAAQGYDTKFFKNGFSKISKLQSTDLYSGYAIDALNMNGHIRKEGFSAAQIAAMSSYGWDLITDSDITNIENVTGGKQYYIGDDLVFTWYDNGDVEYDLAYAQYRYLNLVTRGSFDSRLIDPMYFFYLRKMTSGVAAGSDDTLYINKKKLIEIVGTL